MVKSNNKLFTEFPEVTTKQWEEKIMADLKGKDYEKTLVWRTNEGFSVNPYYRADILERKEFSDSLPGEFPFVRGNQPVNNWLIRQDMVVKDPLEANKKALELLGKGVNSLGLIFDCSVPFSLEKFQVLLKDICLEAAEINLTCSCRNCDLVEVFTDLVLSGAWNVQNITASVNNDPLSAWMLEGKFYEGTETAAFDRLKILVEKGFRIPGLRTIGVNGKYFGNSGSSIVQELAFSLAMGSEYLHQLTDRGLSPDAAAQKIRFNFSISNNYFMEVAKLRAARLLWAQIVKAFGAGQEESMMMIAHCETGSFNKTIYDPWVNLLRTQTEAMSAALGGAHSVTVLPFDAVYREPSAFSERIARNQQILLKEESYIDKTADVAGGSYYIENLTCSIVDQAWKLFLESEESGGFISAMRTGFIQNKIKETAAWKNQNIATRRENLLGVNQFPNFTETIHETLDDTVFQPMALSREDAEIETLKPWRAAQSLEALRYKTDCYSMKHKRPVAFLLTMGNLAMRKARAQFSCNFFAVAGFQVIDNNGFPTVAQGIKAADAAKADFIVVCSSDEEYAVIVPELAAKVNDKIIVVAGNPGCRPDLEAIGIKNFIHVKSNLLQELTSFQKLVLK
jgi:methylmalonyl-CoA mutase